MECPSCKGLMLDMRATKVGKQPDYTCANPACVNDKGYRTGVWLRRGPQPLVTGYAKEQAPKQPLTERPAALRETGDALPWETDPRDERAVLLFWDCFDKVLEGVARRKLTDLFKPENLASLTATLYIQRSKIS